MSPPGLGGDSLREAMIGYGIEVDMHPFGAAFKARPVDDIDLIVIFLTRYEPTTRALIQQRMSELRASFPDIPAIALLESADRDSGNILYELGFTAVVLGLPSVKIALAVIHLVLLGGPFITSEIRLASDTVAKHDTPSVAPAQKPDNLFSNMIFTKREIALLEHLRAGMQNKLIAYRLGISESTVKAHLRNIMTKLQAKNRTEVIFLLSRDSIRQPD